MNQVIAVVIIFATVIAKQVAHSQVTTKYFVKPDVCSDRCNTIDITVYLNWSIIQHNISRYFTSHTDIFFSPGEYVLDQQLTITDVENFTITGRSTAVFTCTNEAGVFINDSIFLRIKRIHFINCGISVMNTTSALHLYNVRSIILSDIVFENSIGPGIAGVNILGSSAGADPEFGKRGGTFPKNS